MNSHLKNISSLGFGVLGFRDKTLPHTQLLLRLFSFFLSLIYLDINREIDIKISHTRGARSFVAVSHGFWKVSAHAKSVGETKGERKKFSPTHLVKL